MSAAPAVYTHGHHSSVLRSHQWRTAANSAAYLLPHLAADQALLDVGCGPGTITADLATRVGAVTAIDTSAEVLEQARSAATERGVDNVEFAVADVFDLPFQAGRFDVIHAHQVLQHVSDPVRALRRLREVCADDGIVAARDADYAAMAWYPQLPELDEWLALYRRIAAGNGGQPDAGRRLRSWARSAGFTQVTASASTWCYAEAAGRDWWAGMWADRILHSAIATEAVAKGHCERSDLERISAAWRRWAADDDGWFVVVHGEIICRP